MAGKINEIQKVSAATKNAVARKSAQTLPNRPSEQGYSAEEIKRRFYQPIIDAANSALAEIDRIVAEMNVAFSQVGSFIDGSEIKSPYKKDLDNSVWVHNAERDRYEFEVTTEMHSVEDYREISVDMYLIAESGKLVNVNNYEVFTDGKVRLFNDNTGGGFVTISRNRDGYIKSDVVTDVENITGIAKVAKTNQYNDLDGKPDLSRAQDNEQKIGEIISGIQTVALAKKATDASYATNAGHAETAARATLAETATNAIRDSDGRGITTTYAMRDGTYSGMTVGTANFANSASKATYDSLDRRIIDTYLTKTEMSNVVNERQYSAGNPVFDEIWTGTSMEVTLNSTVISQYRAFEVFISRTTSGSLINATLWKGSGYDNFFNATCFLRTATELSFCNIFLNNFKFFADSRIGLESFSSPAYIRRIVGIK